MIFLVALLASGGLTLGGRGALALLSGLAGFLDADAAGDAGLHALEHALGDGVDGDTVGDLLLHPGDFGDEVEALLALLLLHLEGDAADGAASEALHDVGGVAGDLVLELLGGAKGAVKDDTLVDVEVTAEAGEVVLNDLASSALGGLGADLAHVVCV